MAVPIRLEIAYALRRLRTNPIVALTVTLTMMIVIAAATIVYSVVDAILIRPLPYSDAGALISIGHRSSASRNGPMVVSAPGFHDYQQLPSIAAAAVENETGFNLTGTRQVERVTVLRASGDWFRVYGVPPLIGRWLNENDQIPGNDRVVVLFYGVWQRQFGGDTSIIGRTIQLNAEPYRVVGVMRPGFKSWFKPHSEMVVPLALTTRNFEGRYASAFYNFTARLRRGATVERLTSELNVLASRVRLARADEVPFGFRMEAQSLSAMATAGARPALFMMSGAIVFLVVIACANIAGLLLARGAAKSSENVLRRALGAQVGDLLRLSMIESLALSVIGTLPGVALAFVGLRFLLAKFPDIPRAEEMSINWGSVAFAIIAAALTGAAFGLLPALRSSRAEAAEALRSGSKGGSLGGGRSERSALGTLVSAQIALSLSLLVITGSLLKSMQRLRAVDVGFDARHALVFNLSLPKARYPSDTAQRQFIRQLTARLSAMPNVRGAGTTSVIPFGGHWATASIMAEGQPAANKDLPVGDLRVVSPGFFGAMGIAVIRGRGFTENDDGSSPPVAIIDQTYAERYFRGDPIGKRITVDPQPDQRDSVWVTIVGVVAHTAHEALDGPRRIQYYFPYAQQPGANVVMAIGTTGDPTTALPGARTAIRELDPDLPLASVSTMDEMIESSIAQRRLATVLLGIFSAVATALACLAVYGNLSFMVSRRSRELGIRRALGSESGALMWEVLRASLTRVIPGVAAGLVIGLSMTRLVRGQLYDVAPVDLPVVVASTLLLVLVAAAAAVIPARRSMRADPLVVLRAE